MSVDNIDTLHCPGNSHVRLHIVMQIGRALDFTCRTETDVADTRIAESFVSQTLSNAPYRRLNTSPGSLKLA